MAIRIVVVGMGPRGQVLMQFGFVEELEFFPSHRGGMKRVGRLGTRHRGYLAFRP